MKINIKQIGDMHFNKSFTQEDLDNLRKTICDNTDYIIFVGDIIDSTNVIKDEKLRNTLIMWFKKISQDIPVIIEIGNHDIAKSYDNRKSWSFDNNFNFWSEISKIENVYFLPEQTFYKDKKVCVTGINPSFYYYENGDLDKSKDEILYLLKNNNLLKKIPKNKLNIFVCHSPIHMTDNEVLEYINNFDLILSGHMHNGLVFSLIEKVFPKNRGIISPLRRVFPDNARGIKNIKYNDKNIKLVITGGVTKLAVSHGFLKIINKLYPSVVEEIIYDTNSKKININTLKIKKTKN